jgi:hypothetical protein
VARVAVLVAIALLSTLPSRASNAVSLGYSDETTIVGPGTDACASGVLIHAHDGAFEDGYAWRYGGVVSPYFGALGEGYDIGAGTIACVVFWLTTLPGFWEPTIADCYVWDGGIGTTPGAVLRVVTNAELPNMTIWPTFGENDVDMSVSVDGPFTIGYWGPWPGASPWYFCGADLDGPGGHPWTCIAPGIGYPSGWQDPSIVWGPTSALGIGAYFEQATPVETETWGAVKALFR